MRRAAISTHPFADATLISEALDQTFKQHFDEVILHSRVCLFWYLFRTSRSLD